MVRLMPMTIDLTLTRAAFTVEGHSFVVSPTGEVGVHTQHPRYRVDCETCSECVHEATTGVAWNVDFHIRTNKET
jgi:hypothetical protein